MSELEHFWWEERDSGYQVDVKKLLFSITATELCIVELLHTSDNKYPERVPRDVLIERWKAKILNLRKLPKMVVVRSAYYQWFNKKGDTRETYPSRWKAAWDTANYYFKCDLETAWEDITIEDLKKKLKEG